MHVSKQINGISLQQKEKIEEQFGKHFQQKRIFLKVNSYSCTKKIAQTFKLEDNHLPVRFVWLDVGVRLHGDLVANRCLGDFRLDDFRLDDFRLGDFNRLQLRKSPPRAGVTPSLSNT